MIFLPSTNGGTSQRTSARQLGAGDLANAIVIRGNTKAWVQDLVGLAQFTNLALQFFDPVFSAFISLAR